jgi:3-dehydroquinate synthase
MKTVQVNASNSYRVLIGSGLLPQLGEHMKEITGNCKAAIVSDSNVYPLYGAIAARSLENAGFEVIHFVFPAGESSKNGDTYLKLLNYLADNHLTRTDCLIALGGGVVGDLTGFAAATYLRGIAYIQVPTTLLAAVDSSVGGKTAIDLTAGKNLCGAFYQPSLVLCDTDTLNTLSMDIFRDGCAEVIKYGVLYDEALFDLLAQTGISFPREDVIARCVQHKRDVVASDEFDRGARQKLNLGHTIGHGVEAHSHFQISHGKAVAIGMAIVSRAAASTGMCTTDTSDRICRVIQSFGLPTHTEFTAQQLMDAALSDKKRSGATINLILPKKIGSCVIETTAIAHLQSFIEAGL